MGRAERRAILLLLGLAVAGHGARWWAGGGGEAPGAVGLPAAGGGVEAQREASVRAGAPLGPGEVVDPDLASARELARVPGIGPSLARRIVADREARGPFRTPEGLDRVPGVGPGTLRRAGPHLRFAGGPIQPAVLDLNSASAEELERLPGLGPARARAVLAYREAHGPFASIEDLSRVPGIGRKLVQALAERVVVR